MASKSNRKYILLRYLLVIFFMLLLSGAIVYKSVDTCVVHAADWNKKAEKELATTREIMPERGDILAHDGLVLATSMTYYQAVIDFSGDEFDHKMFKDSLPALCDSLAKYFPKRNNRTYTAKMYRESLQRAHDKLDKKGKHLRGYTLLPEVTGKDIRLLSSFPFLKEKRSKTGFYINQKDGGYEAYIDFSVKDFDKELFLANIDTLCVLLDTMSLSERSAEDYKALLQEGYASRSQSKGKITGKKIKLLEELSYKESRALEELPFLSIASSKNGFSLFKTGGKTIKRVKPYGRMASRAIGGLNKVSQRGSSGLEKALDSLLFGVPGRTVRRQLSSGMADWVAVHPQRGLDVKTTIDVVIQDFTEEALEEAIQLTQPEFGVAIVMEVATGEIKAMSNLTRLPSGVYSEECRNNAVLPYEPGSVIKLLTMMIALEDGVVTPTDKLNHYNGSFKYLSGKPITDTKAHPDLDVTNAITYSSNIGLAQIGIKGWEHNPARYIERVHEIGFMEPFNLGIAGESLPYFPPLKNNNGGRIDLSRIAYGYTSMIPPIYTLAFYNAIANDGKFVRPRLVKELIRDGVTDTVFQTSYIREQMCKPEVAKQLQHMLYTVVNTDGGTGRAIRKGNVTIAGKTGTAWTQEEGAKGYTKGSYRITFCGYFPYENPQYTCIVLLNQPALPGMPSAGRYCGGAVRRIAESLYSLGRLETPNQSLPDTLVIYDSGMLHGDIMASQKVLQQTKMNGDVANCYSANAVFDSIPDVRGMGARDAVHLLENLGLEVTIQGRGKVVEQSIAVGTPIVADKAIVLTLK